MKDIKEILGYHGTYLANCESITKNNFFESTNHTEWMGNGVYFFVTGVSNTPAESAKMFAEDERFKDNREGKVSIDEEICVMEAIVNVDNNKYLDLDVSDGIELFNIFRDESSKKLEQSGKKSIEEIKDYHILMIMREALDIEFVKRSVYIKFGILRKKKLFRTEIPNVTIFVVNKPENNIDKSSIKKVL